MAQALPSDGTVLLIDDDESLAALVRRYLELSGWSVEVADDGASGLAALERSVPGAVLLDLHLPDLDGLEVLDRLRRHHRHLPVIMLTADSQVDSVVTAMQRGALDYLTKPVDRIKLRTTVGNALEHGRLTVRLAQLEREVQDEGFGAILGRSEPMRELFRRMERISASEISALIFGESGTGKELVARALHDQSSRRRNAFVALNCAAIPESIQESELFGHEKGAFTGADRRRAGRFEQAHGGTLFLDEVAELSPPLQAKLLRVLQEKSFHRLGGDREVRSDFRLLAASHKDLGEEVAGGRFREDLFYRIAVFELRVPPLRDRGGDIRLLARRFLEEQTEGEPPVLSVETLQILEEYSWPGNVRELLNAVQHALVVQTGDRIQRRDLPRRILDALERPLAAEAAAAPSAPSAGASPRAPPEPLAIPQLKEQAHTLGELEELAIRAALERNGGNISAAIRELGIGRATLYRKLSKYGIR